MNYVLVALVAPPPITPPGPVDPRLFFLESLDGSVSIPMRGPRNDRHPWGLRGDALGLDLAPTDVEYAALPGGRGAVAGQVIERERSVALPLVLRAGDYEQSFALKTQLHDLISPAVRPEGFRLVCATAGDKRALVLHCDTGFEGHQVGGPFVEHIVLSCTAADPIAYDMEPRVLPFPLGEGEPFLGGNWGSISLGPSAVTGDGAVVQMGSSVPVWPTITITGPVDSALITADTGLRIDVPAALDEGEELRIVTDPRGRSIELDGDPAAGRLARGSRLVPFPQGTSLIEVAAPGAMADTLLTLEYVGGNRSLW